MVLRVCNKIVTNPYLLILKGFRRTCYHVFASIGNIFKQKYFIKVREIMRGYLDVIEF